MDVIEHWFTVGSQVHSAKQHYLVIISYDSMPPAWTWEISIQRQGTPSIACNIVDMQVVKGNILNNWEYSIVSTTENYELILEESSRVLRSGYWASTLWSETYGCKLHFGSKQAIILTIFLRYALGILCNIRCEPEEIICCLLVFIDAAKQKDPLLHHACFLYELL